MKKFIVAVLLSLSLMGCGAAAEEPGTNQVDDKTSTGYGNGSLIPDSEYYVKKVTIDGTDCIIFKDGDTGLITCNWSETSDDTY